VSACSEGVSREVDREFEKGHNGILWGESKAEAANWIRSGTGVPVKVVKQANPDIVRQAKANRKKYTKKLGLSTVSDIQDDVAVVYFSNGFQYLMSFDSRDRFCAVTFGPGVPLQVVGDGKKMSDTQKSFEGQILKPLIQQFGKPKSYKYRIKDIESRYWVWKGKKVNYVLEFSFAKGKKNVPPFWQFSQSVILAKPKYFVTNK
jgi:hypothetical protein